MMMREFLNAEDIIALQKEEAASTKEQKRTPEQIEAIYTYGQNVLVSASAGSGKTFVMVERILDKLKRGVGIDQLFISTFTVKAAGELKERIEKNLTKAIASSQDQELRRHLVAQLTDLEHADIGTMDSFTQKLVTSYGHLLGVSPNFRILTDKNEQDLIKHEVFDDLFTDYMRSKDQDIFKELVRNFTGNRKDYKAFRDVVYQIHTFSQATSSPKKWLTEQLLKGYAIYKDWESLPPAMVEGFLDAMVETAEDLQDVTDLPDYKQVTAKGSPTATYKKHQAILQGLRDLHADFESTKKQTDFPTLLKEVVTLLPSGSEVTVAGQKYPVFKNIRSRLQDLQHLETILTYQPLVLPLLKLLQEVVLDFSHQYLQAKMQENAYEFADISHFAIDILENHSDIRTYYQEKYHEVMVDEYQDNNHTQERMLDLISNGHNRFMVGDIKQSIYRFRQADPQIFQSKFEAYQTNPDAGKLILLKENFRSQTEVLDVTNAIFSRLMDKEVGQIKYDSSHQLVAGSVRQTILQPKHRMEYLVYNTDSDDSETNNDISQGEVELVAKEIIRLHNEEKVAFSDITLLVPSRTRNEGIIQSFERHGIPLVTDGGEANYLKSLEVMVMLDTLRTVNNPLNDYSLVALLKSPMFQFNEDELTRIALQADTGFFYTKLERALTGQGSHPDLILPSFKEKLMHFQTFLISWRSFAKRHSIYDLIWKIFNDKFYYDYAGALPNGVKRQANLYALGLRANAFEKTGFKGLSRFISMIDKVLASENDLADVEVALPQNAVQLMTVHKSKGLEFKYVFLLNMDKAFNAMESRSSIILSRENGIGVQYLADLKDRFDTPLPHLRVAMNTLPYQVNQRELKIANLSEQMRLLYVAMTRAEKKLYFVGKGSKDKLENRYDGKRKNNVLAINSRENSSNFQDWILAIEEAFKEDNLHFTKTFVTDDDLTPDKIGQLSLPSAIKSHNLKENRQSEDIQNMLDQLQTVEEINHRFKAAIELPTLRTPSQIKKMYEPLLAEEGLEIMEKVKRQRDFKLPDFSKKPKISGAQIGSAVHELMQRLPLDAKITAEVIATSLQAVRVDQLIKDKIDSQKIFDFFETDLGREIISNQDKLRREAPFASLQRDAISQEQFVLRGIIDGYLVYSDRIVLFDYKTDRYQLASQLVERYRMQMQLYADTLRRAYQIDQVDTYLILLGGEKIEVVPVPMD